MAFIVVDSAGGGDHTTIQAAVDAASTGDTILITEGTYDESVNVTTAVNFVGVGDVTVGSSTASSFNLTSDLGSGNTVSFDNIDFVGASQSGIDLNGATLGTLEVINSTFEDNGRNGLEIVDGSNLGNTIVTDADFTTNGGGTQTSSGDGDIIFFNYTGDATLTNVDIVGGGNNGSPNEAENAIQFRSDTGAMGNVTLNNVDISGTYEKQPIGIFNYDNVDNLQMTNVTVTADSTSFQTSINFDGIGGDIDFSDGTQFNNVDVSGAPDVVSLQGDGTANAITGKGEAEFIRAFGGNDTVRGNGGNDNIYADNRDGSADTGTVDVAQFSGSISDYTITAETFDLGFGDVDGYRVIGPDGNDFVGQVEIMQFDGDTNAALFVGSGGFETIQAAVDAASAGDTIFIQAGTYDESVDVSVAVNFVGVGAVDVGSTTASSFNLTANLGGSNSVSFDNINFVGASQSGIDLNGATLGTLQVTNSTFTDNGRNGLEVVDGANLGNAIVTDTDFNTNGGGTQTSSGDGDIIFFNYTGDATLTNVNIVGGGNNGSLNEAENAIQFRSDTGAMGNVTLNNVDISGTYEKQPIGIFNYDNVDNLQMTDVTVTADSTSFQTSINFDGIGGDIDFSDGTQFNNVDVSGAPDVVSLQSEGSANEIIGKGDDEFIQAFAGDDTVRGNGGDDNIFADTRAGTADTGTVDVAEFSGSLSDYTITAETLNIGFGDVDGFRIIGPDGNDFVGQAEILAFDGAGGDAFLVGSGGFDSIQEAVDAASAGDTVIIAAGTYDESISLTKALNFVGVGEVNIGSTSGNSFDLVGNLGVGNTVSFDNIDFEGASGSGIRLNGATLGTLAISNSYFEANERNGVEVVDGANLSNASITNTDFVENGQPSGSSGDGDILFFNYNGNATLSNINITGGDRGPGEAENGIQFRSDSGAIGNVALTNIVIDGEFEKQAIGIFNYDNINNLQMSNVTVTADSTSFQTSINIDGVGGIINFANAAQFNNVNVAGAPDPVSLQGDGTANTIIGKGDAEFIRGFGGFDTIRGSGGNDTLLGGANIDTLDYSNTTTGVTVNFNTNQATGSQIGTDTIAEFERVFGGLGSDVITADGNANLLIGNNGNDNLRGEGGNDVLLGGNGNDTLNGGAGADVLTGGSGVDFASYENGNAGLIAILDAQFSIFNTGDASGDVYSSIVGLTGSSNDDFLGGDNGQNGLNGGAGNDQLFGLGAVDFLNGDAGNDTLNGGNGGDILNGGSGSDTASYKVLSGAVTASLANTNKNTGQADGDIYISIENLEGSFRRDSLEGDNNANRLSGVTGNDTLSGLDGNDTLDGGVGRDVLNGGGGFDYASYESSGAGLTAVLLSGFTNFNTGQAIGDSYSGIEGLIGSNGGDILAGNQASNDILGLGGNDILIGLNGNDTLTGGTGNDILRGGNNLTGLGGGNDRFVFGTGDDADRIEGFAAGSGTDDVILLSLGAAFDTFSEVEAVASDVGGNAVLNFGGGDSITLVGVASASLDQDDFLFA